MATDAVGAAQSVVSGGTGAHHSSIRHDGTSELYVIDHGLSWGVLQTPVLPPQRERPEEWAVMPHALL